MCVFVVIWVYYMCKDTNCITHGCPGCQWLCNCEHSCFACKTVTKYGCSTCMYMYPFDAVRNKYVCFPCKRIWKSSVSKYHILNDEYASLKKKHSKLNRATMSEAELRAPPDNGESAYDDFLNVYKNKHSKCAKCSGDGLLVGRNFRHCDSDKKWKELQTRVESNEINLYDDFHDYPRESVHIQK